MNTFFRPAYLSAILFAFVPAICAAATCNGETVSAPGSLLPNPGWSDDIAKFGAYVYAQTRIGPTACDWHTTKNASTGTYSRNPTGVPADAYDASTHSTDNLGRPIDLVSNVTAMQSEFGGGVSVLRRNYGSATGDSVLTDILWLEKPGAASNEVTDIPVKLCFTFSSMWSPEPGRYYGSSASVARAYLTVGAFRYIDTTLSPTHGYWWISQIEDGHWVTDRCITPVLQMTGPGDGFTLRLSLANLGWSGSEYHAQTNSHMVTLEGTMTGTFRILSLPEGVSCKSASGMFPGCEQRIVNKEPDTNDCSAQNDTDSEKNQCNPINIAQGFKVQREMDYASDDLAFIRTYRSDATWVSHGIGRNWRHNYERKLTFYVASAGQTAALSTSRGTTELFRKGNDGAWSPVDLDTTSRFEQTPDGYIYKRGGTSGVEEHFDANGHLTRIAPRGGRALSLTYDGQGRLATVSDELSRSLALAYDSQNRIATLTTPDGIYRYDYDAQSNLAGVTNPDSSTRRYHYEDARFPHGLTGITNEDGVRFATFGYDDQGRATSSQHAGGVEHYQVAYNAAGTTTVTNPLGKQITYTFRTIQGVRKIVSVERHPSANSAGSTKFYDYTPQGWLKRRTDREGNRTTYTYYDDGLVKSKTEADGTPNARTTSYTYVAELRAPDVVSEAGRTTDYDYDAFGRVTTVSITDTSTGETRTTSYTYHPNSTDSQGHTVLGRVKTVDGPRTDVSDVTTYEYDSDGNLAKTINALGQETRFTAYDAAGRVLAMEDANAVATTFTYDALGRLKTSTRGFGTALAQTTTYGYDRVGNLTAVTLPGGITMSYGYDDARRLTGMQDGLGNTITYTLDAAGNRIQEDIHDASGRLSYTHRQVFDELSRLIESVDANAHVSKFSYDLNDNLRQSVDANANTTGFAYDGLNRLRQSTNALAGETVHRLNALDQLEGITDPRSNETHYTRNAFGDLLEQVSPDTGTTTFSYDAAGNRLTRLDARGVRIEYSYDVLGRLSRMHYPSEPAQDVAYTYDAAPDCGVSKGRLCALADAAGHTTYTYDALGRVTKVARARGALTFTTGYTFDAAGLPETITLPSGRTITYSRNAAGQVRTIQTNTSSGTRLIATQAAYAPFGPLTRLDYGNGLSLLTTYDQSYEITRRQVTGGFDDIYQHDPAGNITRKGPQTFAYDELHRLTEESDSADNAFYKYDAIGNRTQETINGVSTLFDYPATNSHLQQTGLGTLTYDAAGNIRTDRSGARSFTYNAAGRLAEVEESGGVLGSYTYDANGQRISKETASGSVQFVYGSGGQLYGEYDAGGTPIREYVYLDGEPIAQIESDNTVTYLHTDHLGTPRVATNSAGAAVWHWDSAAFGKDAPTGNATVNLRFPGQYFDFETGLHYNWNRYYAPESGRYISSDPIGIVGGENTYSYVGGNPLLLVDREGLQALPNTIPPTPPQANPEPSAPANDNLPRSIPTPTTLGVCRGILKRGLGVAAVLIPLNATCKTAPQEFGPLECSGESCEEKYRKIGELVGTLRRRYTEMLIDRNDLYRTARYAPVSKRKGFWEGHRFKYLQRQEELVEAIEDAERWGCTNYHPDAIEWSSTPPPDMPISERIRNIGNE